MKTSAANTGKLIFVSWEYIGLHAKFFSLAIICWYNAFQQFYNAFNGDLQNIGTKCLLDYFQIYHIMTHKTMYKSDFISTFVLRLQ